MKYKYDKVASVSMLFQDSRARSYVFACLCGMVFAPCLGLARSGLARREQYEDNNTIYEGRRPLDSRFISNSITRFPYLLNAGPFLHSRSFGLLEQVFFFWTGSFYTAKHDINNQSPIRIVASTPHTSSMRALQATLVALSFLILLATSLPLDNPTQSLSGPQDASVQARGLSPGADEQRLEERSFEKRGGKKEKRKHQGKGKKKHHGKGKAPPSSWRPPKAPGWRTLGPS